MRFAKPGSAFASAPIEQLRVKQTGGDFFSRAARAPFVRQTRTSTSTRRRNLLATLRESIADERDERGTDVGGRRGRPNALCRAVERNALASHP